MEGLRNGGGNITYSHFLQLWLGEYLQYTCSRVTGEVHRLSKAQSLKVGQNSLKDELASISSWTVNMTLSMHHDSQ